MSRRIWIYPGTFDPITNGHTDIIRRALHVVDHLVIGVARNDAKGPLFSTDERIEVRPFETLLMHFAESVEAGVIVKGLRAVSDFEYEFLMAGMNARLNP